MPRGLSVRGAGFDALGTYEFQDLGRTCVGHKIKVARQDRSFVQLKVASRGFRDLQSS